MFLPLFLFDFEGTSHLHFQSHLSSLRQTYVCLSVISIKFLVPITFGPVPENLRFRDHRYHCQRPSESFQQSALMVAMPAFISPVPLVSHPETTCQSLVRRPRRCCHVRRPKGGVLSVVAKKRGLPDVNVVERDLLDALESLNTGNKSRLPGYVLSPGDSACSDLTPLISKLERAAAGFDTGNRLRSRLPGTWRLAATDASAVAANGGSVTGFASFPGASCSAVDVVLRSDGAAATVEALKIFSFFKTQCTLNGSWSVAVDGSDAVLQVTYEDANLFGFLNLKAKSKSALLTTFCGNNIRIGRSRSNHFYVFTRLIQQES